MYRIQIRVPYKEHKWVVATADIFGIAEVFIHAGLSIFQTSWGLRNFKRVAMGKRESFIKLKLCKKMHLLG